MLKKTYTQKLKNIFKEVPAAEPIRERFLRDMVEFIDFRPGVLSRRKLYKQYVDSDADFFSIVKFKAKLSLDKPLPEREAAAYAALFDYAEGKLIELGEIVPNHPAN